MTALSYGFPLNSGGGGHQRGNKSSRNNHNERSNFFPHGSLSGGLNGRFGENAASSGPINERELTVGDIKCRLLLQGEQESQPQPVRSSPRKTL
ncbi:MAG: hypothetical protein FP825_06020 [Hyphomonas sp.]|uniref:hypothetical protein n=1 Tax=Hyphomonas sp. TaxID=87 RepID=UPI0017EA6FE5|nr:hypothetical protein [Hyphomonas sp.]MBA3068022.1 hypothetical protein [Hyphomonas sp.]MBU3920324.1 hypothetical protein [Alphaproteobacteria bacterium]MBU4061361.1 hypothetical protein [Alphaproteobacteria bacterium]MBU4162614.1 hypothetical protein [Alphaproteobacteria bacterium]